MKSWTSAFALGCVAALLTAGSAAAEAQIEVAGQGWYKSDGTHSAANLNTSTASSGPASRSFYEFDLAGSGPATSISITFYGDVGRYDSTTPETTVLLYDFTGSIDDLLTGHAPATFADLGSGIQLGSATISGEPGANAPMPQFTVNLSSAFVSQFNAALASSDKRIALGAMTPTVAGGFGELWAFSSNGDPAAYLTITNDGVPEPASWALMILGFGAVGATLRRRMHAAETLTG